MSITLTVFILVAGALLTGEIARRKGHGFGMFFIFALLLLILALPWALIMEPKTTDEDGGTPHLL